LAWPGFWPQAKAGTSLPMSQYSTQKRIITEEDEVCIQQAKLDYEARRYPSIRQAAIANEVQYFTLQHRIQGLTAHHPVSAPSIPTPSSSQVRLEDLAPN